MHRIDIGVLGQVHDQRHEDDYRRHRVDEIADDDEQPYQQQHDLVGIIAGKAREPLRHHRRSAQVS